MRVMGQLWGQQCTGVFSTAGTVLYSHRAHMPVLVARLVDNGMHYKKDDAASTSVPCAPVPCLHLSVVKTSYFLVIGVLELGVFLEMVGILEGLVPGRRGVSEVSEQAERVSISSEASEASLPLRLLALLPARLPARLAGPLAEDGVRLLSEEEETAKINFTGESRQFKDTPLKT